MAHKVSMMVSVPDDIYKEVIVPAKQNNTLTALIVESLKLYVSNKAVRNVIDSRAHNTAMDEAGDLVDRLNAIIGGLDESADDLGAEMGSARERGRRAREAALGDSKGGYGDSRGSYGLTDADILTLDSRIGAVGDQLMGIDDKLDRVVKQLQSLMAGGIRVEPNPVSGAVEAEGVVSSNSEKGGISGSQVLEDMGLSGEAESVEVQSDESNDGVGSLDLSAFEQGGSSGGDALTELLAGLV